MNFFKSILLDDPDPPKPENPHESGPNPPLKETQEDRNPNNGAQDGNADGWSFGGLIKTFAARSESVIETYRRDLKEFGSGLKKETEIIREAAGQAVKDLPASLEAGTTAAHSVLDGVLKSTSEIVSREDQVFASDRESESLEADRSLNSGRYSWFEAQLSAIVSDPNTFVEEPEDVEEYKQWKLGFKLEDMSDEIEGLIGENGNLQGVYKRVVPSVVDHEAFWCRYFYRVDKLKQQERVRANLVKRAISGGDDDDELSWDVEDDEGTDANGYAKVKGGDGAGDKGVSSGSLNLVEKGEGLSDGSQHEKEGGDSKVDDGGKINVIDSGAKSVDQKEVKSDEVAGAKSDKNVKDDEGVEGKIDGNVGVEKGESGEKTDVSVVSNHQAKSQEEYLEWDEIEDIGSGDEKKISATTHGGRPNREDLRKQLNDAEDDEDLTWDIDDDDEPVKS